MLSAGAQIEMRELGKLNLPTVWQKEGKFAVAKFRFFGEIYSSSTVSMFFLERCTEHVGKYKSGAHSSKAIISTRQEK